MPIDKIRNTPVDKILSYRRNPQQQQAPSSNDADDCPYFLPSHLNKMSESREQKDDNKDTDSFDTDDSDVQMLPPPRRSPVSQANLQRKFTTSKHCIQAMKFFFCIIIICGLLRLVPFYQRTTADGWIPSILLWNENLTAGISKDSLTYMECGCILTTRRNYSHHAFDAIVINGDLPYTLDKMDMVKHTANYIVVFAARKPFSLIDNPPLTTSTQSPFNFTMTYRLDSDIIWTDHYFSLHQSKRRVKEFTNRKLNINLKLSRRRASVLESKLLMKRHLVMYMMYEVNEYTLPESLYLQELHKYLELDMHDSCRDFNECSLYRFMLVFDPSGCPDYIHPDFYTALENYVVPVMIGGGNLTNLVPPNSYISNNDFASPKDLAEYLKNFQIDEPNDYEKYFWWHNNYILQIPNRPHCVLCHAIREMSRDQKRDSNTFIDWWYKSQCTTSTTTPTTTTTTTTATTGRTLMSF